MVQAPRMARLGMSRIMPDGPTTDLLVRGEARRQSAALPLIETEAGPRVVLITSRETRRWVLPKGWIEPRERPYRSAMREAFEEAGLQGEADRDPVGRYVYAKRLGRGLLAPTEVLVFAFRVTALLDHWPEQRERQRRLFTPHAAALAVEEPELAALLRDLRQG
jgi:8-oxo-dGTP pyrophosphatase MutT (NUDIX family)